MSKAKLSVEDFYHQFHGHEHHNDPGEYTKPEWYKLNPKLKQKHKGPDLRSLRNRKRTVKTVINKTSAARTLEMLLSRKPK